MSIISSDIKLQLKIIMIRLQASDEEKEAMYELFERFPKEYQERLIVILEFEDKEVARRLVQVLPKLQKSLDGQTEIPPEEIVMTIAKTMQV